eukprot:17119-Heterococcus_DN1.PRE.2
MPPVSALGTSMRTVSKTLLYSCIYARAQHIKSTHDTYTLQRSAATWCSLSAAELLLYSCCAVVTATGTKRAAAVAVPNTQSAHT